MKVYLKVDVKERMPDKPDDYIVFDSYGMIKVTFRLGQFEWRGRPITHWLEEADLKELIKEKLREAFKAGRNKIFNPSYWDHNGREVKIRSLQFRTFEDYFKDQNI